MVNKQYCYPKVERIAKRWRRELVDNMTPPERLVLSYLRKLDYEVEFQKIIFHSRGKFYIVDFYLPDYGLIIEVDGKQHYYTQNRMNDELRTHRLKKAGVKDVIRFSNRVCKKGDYFKTLIKDTISNYINKYS